MILAVSKIRKNGLIERVGLFWVKRGKVREGTDPSGGGAENQFQLAEPKNRPEIPFFNQI